MATSRSDELEALTEISGTNPPRPSLAGTLLIVAPLILANFILSFLVQVLVALITLPFLCSKVGRGRFQHIQSIIWRSFCAIFGVALNPLWSVDLIKADTEDVSPEEVQTGSVYFCNHRSNADPWIAAMVFLKASIEARFVYKSSLGNVPFAGCSMRLAGDLPAKFGDKEQIKEMLEQAKELLRNGYNICVFPEGTRSPSGLLQDFKPTFFQICADLGCPAVPLVLLGSEQAWPTGGFSVGCARMTSMLGQPIMPDGGDGEGLMAKVAEAMQALAQKALEEEVVGPDDPLLTGKPYSWWKVPQELQGLSEEEQMQLLRSGKAHQRGKNLF